MKIKNDNTIIYFVVIILLLVSFVTTGFINIKLQKQLTQQTDNQVEIGPQSSMLLKERCISVLNNNLRTQMRNLNDEFIWYNTSVVGLRNISFYKLGSFNTTDIKNNTIQTDEYGLNCFYVAYYEQGVILNQSVVLRMRSNHEEEEKWKN